MTAAPVPEAARTGPRAGQPLHRAIAAVAARLAQAGIETPATDARLLAATALGLDRTGLLARRDRCLTGAEADALVRLADRRAAREPTSRIVGRREFWSLDFSLTPATLDPRPDSETLVAAVLDRLTPPDRPWRIVDLGTGSGCLLLALLAERPHASGIGVDRAAAAAVAARDNARRLGLDARTRFVVGDWAESIRGPVDAILANPPYIPTDEIDALAPEVARFDPRPALDGGADGLAAYRVLIPRAAAILDPGGWLAMEIGATQAPAVAALAGVAGLSHIAAIEDLGGRPRVVVGQKSLGRGGFYG